MSKFYFRISGLNRVWSVLFILLTSFLVSSAQDVDPISEKTKNMKLFEGFINYFWDESTGKIWFRIDELDKEILYQTSLPAGLGSNDIGLDREAWDQPMS